MPVVPVDGSKVLPATRILPSPCTTTAEPTALTDGTAVRTIPLLPNAVSSEPSALYRTRAITPWVPSTDPPATRIWVPCSATAMAKSKSEGLMSVTTTPLPPKLVSGIPLEVYRSRATPVCGTDTVVDDVDVEDFPQVARPRDARRIRKTVPERRAFVSFISTFSG